MRPERVVLGQHQRTSNDQPGFAQLEELWSQDRLLGRYAKRNVHELLG